ncbi:hypothetical protein DEW08_26915 (plasmid) [Azospirillum thermophilum]|uniref:Tetratricopeptide repeat protein n=2 Tax=Azospirillum thermophilum TaxID=2202148 RepID=A0A2S2CZF2_9PROT|nr:hypothetical protein DEW08_26915 [Azospirillum thermophilum]
MLRVGLMATMVLGGVSALGATALAQQVPTPNTDAQVNEAFREVLRSPGNLQAGQTYARLLVAAGNYEGGIAALERLLLDPAADPSIRVELGVLYYRVESYGMAEGYLRAALADPRLSNEVRKVAESLVQDIARRTAPGGFLVGSLSVGLRGQTNPTAAARSDRLMFGGAPYTRGDELRRKGGMDAFLSANAAHEWDFGTQDSATLVTTANLFANRYRNAADYNTRTTKYDPRDLVALGATTGVRFKPAPSDAPDLTVRPYLAGSELLLDGHQYMASAGVGLDVDYRLNGGATLVGATYDIRRTAFADRADIFESGAQSGYEQFLQLRGTQEVAPLQTVGLDVVLRDHNASRRYFAYRSVEARATYSVNYSSPFGGEGRLWGSSLYAGPTLRQYDGSDPLVDPSVTRRDVEWRVGAKQVVPVVDSISLVLAVEYATSDSNLPNYSYGNLIGQTSVVWNF